MASSDTTTPDDRPRLRVGDHVRDREMPTQTLLVLEHTEIPANEYPIGMGPATSADVHPEYDPTSEILRVAYPNPTAPSVSELIIAPIPRARLELVTRFHGGHD
ncbi:hypothetical protein [Natronococcus occultus]|uniref:Uncharacterized protein n=1 Tax=Natronococcus occultus SP4 TaxID=694430 RepID=L0JYS9_9EURY|nr:hypothetical protein [Natronococcus occultus]AGB37018.1 hypothetical protein Natoc_1181 [Natronococcus occultus SP4]